MHVGGDTAPWDGLLVRGGRPYRMLGSALLEECPQACSAEHVVGRMEKVVGEGTDSGEPAAGVGSASRAPDGWSWAATRPEARQEPGGEAPGLNIFLIFTGSLLSPGWNSNWQFCTVPLVSRWEDGGETEQWGAKKEEVMGWGGEDRRPSGSWLMDER